jgi:predicted nucleic acid-binding Zn ribbon protein
MYHHLDQRHKTCPVCGDAFIGRPDQVYCTLACKTMHNNGLARERRLAEKRIAGGLLRNHQILKTLLDDAGQDSMIVDTSVLGALGFDRNAPSSLMLGNGTPYRLYGGIAFSVNEANNKASIFKIK